MPYGFLRNRLRFAAYPEVKVGLGIHPWWVASGCVQAQDLALLASLMPEAPYVGEIGLDFSGLRKDTAERQLAVFDAIIESCMQPLVCAPAAQDHERILSIHAVKSATQVLDILEDHGATRRHACILHWFSGSSDELQRAIKLGCWFSAGERMLATKRGREYLRAIPVDRLLVETDGPARFQAEPWDSVAFRGEAPVPDPRLVSWPYGEWEDQIRRTRELIAEIRS
jgi:TatD DNase family protein